MGSESTRERVPAHLRRYVVEQDWEAYTPVDHAVWRFVLVQLYDRLVKQAHPAYACGLARTGMGVERIPRIAEMDARLRELGWGAVCVDGFIPPRAFQELQALGILPIAAEIRRVEHLAYTPAPDIIHEAGGHAPILPDPAYAAFLRRIGECGMRAFGSPHDAALYEAIYDLSETKESRDASPADVERAAERLAELTEREPEPSEAARLARLYWWTVEYGLVGTPQDYRIYGAGLLSSLGESHFCHDPAVRKLPLDASCVDVGYDITRPQPQLFVVPELAALDEVLDAACAGFAFRRGGLAGLRTALDSGEVATVELGSGLSVTGRLVRAEAVGAAVWMAFDGRCGLARDGSWLPGTGPSDLPAGLAVVLGDEIGLQRQALPAGGTRLLRRGELLFEGTVIALPHGEVGAVARGALDPDYWPQTPWPTRRVPAPVEPTPMHDLYRRVEARRHAGAHASSELLEVLDALDADHPDEWLLRFYLLEALQRLNTAPERRCRLVSDLARLERHYGGRCPIATGLRYLGHAPANAASG